MKGLVPVAVAVALLTMGFPVSASAESVPPTYPCLVSLDGTWEELAFPGPWSSYGRGGMVYVPAEDALFVTQGGESCETGFGSISVPDLVWKNLTPSTNPATGAGIAYDGADFIYATKDSTCADPSPLSRITRYSITGGTWASLKSPPKEINDTGIAFLGGYLYALLGGTCTTDLYRLNTVLDQWESLSAYPGGSNTAWIVSDGERYLYAGAGSCGTGFHRYDTQNPGWTQLPAVPWTSLYQAATMACNHVFVVQSGASTGFAAYDIAGDAWTTLPALPVAVDKTDAFAFDQQGHLYLLDGSNDGGVLYRFTLTGFVAPSDADGDGVWDSDDNCPDSPNPGQEDSDGDGIGDGCESAPPADEVEAPDVVEALDVVEAVDVAEALDVVEALDVPGPDDLSSPEFSGDTLVGDIPGADTPEPDAAVTDTGATDLPPLDVEAGQVPFDSKDTASPGPDAPEGRGRPGADSVPLGQDLAQGDSAQDAVADASPPTTGGSSGGGCSSTPGAPSAGGLVAIATLILALGWTRVRRPAKLAHR